MNEKKGSLYAGDFKFAIVVSKFNEIITNFLYNSAVNTLKFYDVKDSNLDTFRVPGVMEVPAIAKAVGVSAKYNAIICLGAVIKGETPHFEYLSSASLKEIMRISVDISLPLLYGIITANDLQQAMDRAGGKLGNKGADCAVSAIEMAYVYKSLNKNSLGLGFQ